MSGIRVGIEPRVVTARDVYRNAVPPVEDDSCGPKVDLNWNDDILLHGHFPLQSFAVASPEDAIGE